MTFLGHLTPQPAGFFYCHISFHPCYLSVWAAAVRLKAIVERSDHWRRPAGVGSTCVLLRRINNMMILHLRHRGRHRLSNLGAVEVIAAIDRRAAVASQGVDVSVLE